MPQTISPRYFKQAPSLKQLWEPIQSILPLAPPLESGCNRELSMDFEHQLKALIFFHLQDHTSGLHLIQTLQEDEYAREVIAPPRGIKKSTFFEAINSRGLEQLMFVFKALREKAAGVIPKQYENLGDLVSIDGSLIDACLSMFWADYRKGAKKAKVHFGLDINRSIPRKIFLTDGNGGERPFVSLILDPGQTGIMDRGYQDHQHFDSWQEEEKHFVCRIKANTKKTCLQAYHVDPDSIVFYDAKVRLGQAGQSQTQIPLRLVGYYVEDRKFWVATDRFDLTAEEIALIYQLRWEVEKFFAWWKRHLRVYHLIARSEYGLMVQIMSGLITYLLLSIYCHEQHGEKVSIKRVRELRNKIKNEIARMDTDASGKTTGASAGTDPPYAFF